MQRVEQLRVAIFQVRNSLQIHTANVAEALARRGHEVDVFLCGVEQRYAERAKVPGLAYHEYPAAGYSPEETAMAGEGWRRSLTLRRVRGAPRGVAALSARAAGFARYVRMRARWGFWGDAGVLVDRATLGRLRKISRERCYDSVIGVESYGLIVGEHVTRGARRKLVYYSLEIEGIRYEPVLRQRLLHKLERAAHARCDTTIIQDPDRWNVLRKFNRLEASSPCFLPVGVSGEARNTKSGFLHEKLGIPGESKIALLFGYLVGMRQIHDLIEAAKTFPAGWVLVMHGPGFSWEAEELARRVAATEGKVYLSTELVPQAQVEELVASASVGLTFYPPMDANHMLTARSSEKMALYAKCGIPVIANNYPSFEEVFSLYRSGLTVDSFAKIPGALAEIDRNYERYSAGAREAFVAEYSFDRTFPKIVDRLLP